MVLLVCNVFFFGNRIVRQDVLTIVVGELGEGFNVVEGVDIKHGSKSKNRHFLVSITTHANCKIRPS